MKPSSLVLALLLSSCGTSTPPPSDVQSTDATAPRPDVVLPPTPSGVNTSICATAVDANATGQLQGEALVVSGSTQTPTAVMAAPCNSSVTGHQVYRYRIRGQNVSLRATTNMPGGTDYLDTVVWVLDGCSETAPVEACNDDDSSAELGQLGTSTVNTRSLAQNTEVTIVVATYSRVRRGAQSRGTFTLQLTETPAAGPDAVCDSTIPGGCISGWECASTSETQGRCTQAGTETEPNDDFANPGPSIPIARGTVYAIHASLDPPRDRDCFAIELAEGSNLWIEASDGGGGCEADLRLDVYRAGETDPFDGDDDWGRQGGVACPRVDPASHESAQNMPAGTYVACVRESVPDDVPTETVLDRYSVHISVE